MVRPSAVVMNDSITGEGLFVVLVLPSGDLNVELSAGSRDRLCRSRDPDPKT